jgi:steroid Delta-isomerase
VATAQDLRALVDRYCAAVTSRDPAAIAALFAEDAVQKDPVSAPANEGREAIRTFFQAAVDASTATTFRALAVHTAGDHVAIDFEVVVSLEAGTMTISGIEVFTVGADGLISGVSAYWDEADVTFGEG